MGPPERRGGWGKWLATLALLGLLALGIRIGYQLLKSGAFDQLFQKSADSRAAATWNYWQAFHASAKTNRLDQVDGQLETAATPQQASSLLRERSRIIDQICSEIDALPLLNVDPDAAAYVSQLVAFLREGAAFNAEFAAFIDDVRSTSQGPRFAAIGLNALIQVFLGDPRGAYNTLDAQGKRLGQRAEALDQRFRALSERGNKLDSQQLGVRATLSQRYNREFPNVD